MKTLLLTLALALPGWGAITFNSVANDSFAGSGVSSRTWNHTVAAGNYRGFWVTSDMVGNGNPTSVKFAGVALTVVPGITGCTSAPWSCQTWWMPNPPVGTFPVVVTFPATDQSFHGGVFSSIVLNGVNQDLPSVLNSLDAVAVTNNTITTSVTTVAANDWIIGHALSQNGTLTAANGQTESINVATAGALTAAAGYLGPVSAGANTMGWTRSGGTGDHGVVLVAVKPFTANPTSSGVHTTSFAPAPRPYATSIFNTANGTGDTQMGTWVSAATRAGPWNGGSIIVQYNDGIGNGCVSRNICLTELLTYDPVAPSATFGLVNDMSSYGGSSGQDCYDGVHEMKSRKPFSLNGVLYLPIFCMTHGSPFDAFASGLIMSPDGGAHWCNYKTFQAGGNTCTSANWKADGDNPVDAAGFQWPLADGTNKMTRLMHVEFLCQENTNCPVAAGVDPAYLYLAAFPSSNTSLELYMSRVAKSLGTAIMLPANYDVVSNPSGPVWTAAGASGQPAADISGGVVQAVGVLAASSWSYLKDFGVFSMWNQSNGTLSTTAGFATAPTPWGPWTKAPDFVTGQATILGFPGPLAGLCPKYNGGRVGCTVLGNGASNTDTVLTEFDLGPQGPTWVAGTVDPIHWMLMRRALER
jgi:hypothetical protein